MSLHVPSLLRAVAHWQRHLSAALDLAAARHRPRVAQARLDRQAPYEADLAEALRAWNEDEEDDVLAFLQEQGEVPWLATVPREDRLTEVLAAILLSLWMAEWRRTQTDKPRAVAGGYAVEMVRRAAQSYLATTQRWLDEQVTPLVSPAGQPPERPAAPLVMPATRPETVQEAVRLVYERTSSTRATQVAVTEATRMAQAAAYEIARAEGRETLTWHTAGDSRVCLWCLDLEGTTVTIDTPLFFRGDTYTNSAGKTMDLNYADVYHPGLHVGCRCWLE